MDFPKSPIAKSATSAIRQCVFCLEEVRQGASVCPHCGSNLAPLQSFADKNAALEQRLSTLEHLVAELQSARADLALEDAAAEESDVVVVHAGMRWPHMFDNIVLGLLTLLATHWLTTLLPVDSSAVFRLVGLIVALPFGYRFEWNSRSDTSIQIIAAVAFGSLGTISNGVLDLALAGHRTPLFTATNVAMSVAAITLSHYAGSALAAMRPRHSTSASGGAPWQCKAALSGGPARVATLQMIEPARIKTAADVIKALSDAAVPIMAGVAALWAAIGHIQF